MIPFAQEYCGDAAMRESLSKVGSSRTLHEIFMKGLDLGETRDEDFSGDALGAMEHLAGLAAYLSGPIRKYGRIRVP